MASLLSHVAHVRAAEAQPEELRDQRAVLLLQAQELVAELPVAGEHVHTTGRDLPHDESAIEHPEQPRRQLVAHRVVPLFADTEHDVRLVGTQDLVHAQDQLRGFLEVGRHDREAVSARELQPRAHGRERSEVPGQERQP